jgi:hypothetical protein
MPKRACVEAIRKSDISAICRPAPAATGDDRFLERPEDVVEVQIAVDPGSGARGIHRGTFVLILPSAEGLAAAGDDDCPDGRIGICGKQRRPKQLTLLAIEGVQGLWAIKCD